MLFNSEYDTFTDPWTVLSLEFSLDRIGRYRLCVEVDGSWEASLVITDKNLIMRSRWKDKEGKKGNKKKRHINYPCHLAKQVIS